MDSPIEQEDGTAADAFDPADKHTSWDQVDALADRFAQVADGDKVAAKALYRELAGG